MKILYLKDLFGYAHIYDVNDIKKDFIEKIKRGEVRAEDLRVGYQPFANEYAIGQDYKDFNNYTIELKTAAPDLDFNYRDVTAAKILNIPKKLYLMSFYGGAIYNDFYLSKKNHFHVKKETKKCTQK